MLLAGELKNSDLALPEESIAKRRDEGRKRARKSWLNRCAAKATNPKSSWCVPSGIKLITQSWSYFCSLNRNAADVLRAYSFVVVTSISPLPPKALPHQPPVCFTASRSLKNPCRHGFRTLHPRSDQNNQGKSHHKHYQCHW